jgi:hypothetical protein
VTSPHLDSSHLLSTRRNHDFFSWLSFLTNFPQTCLSPSPLDMIDTKTREGNVCYRLMKKLMVSLFHCSCFVLSLYPSTSLLLSLLLSALLLSETVPVALLPSQSLQSESRPTPRRSPRQRSKSESGPQAEFVEEGVGVL